MCVVAPHARAAPMDGRCKPLQVRAPRRLPPACVACADSPLSATLRGWRRRDVLRDGTPVLLRPALVAEGPALTVMLADAFAVAMNATEYRKFLGREVSAYITARLATSPEQAALLVAVPCTDDGDQGGASDLLLGVVELSLTPRTHGRFDDPSVTPPRSAAFVKNVLSSPAARRRGVAAALLAGVEEYAAAVAAARGADETPLEMLCLHCNPGDTPAAALYAAAGYSTVSRQNVMLAALRRGAPPLALLSKRLARPPLS